MISRKKKHGKWYRGHVGDFHVKLASKKGYRSRAAFKLLEIQKKDRLILPGMLVADLGAAPGSWSQILSALVTAKGKIFAIDLAEMAPIENVVFVKGDLTQHFYAPDLEEFLGAKKFDVVVSDIAPNLSGIHQTDQAKMYNLFEFAVKFVKSHLKPGGTFLVKCFQGVNISAVRGTMCEMFNDLTIRKPKASRDKSSEVYFLGREFVWRNSS